MAAIFDSFPYDNNSMDEQDWKAMMQWIRTDGVLTSTGALSNVGDLFVAPSSGLILQVYPGLAWIQGFYFSYTIDPLNPGNYTFSIEPNVTADPRIDLVVLTLDLSNNETYIEVVQGAPAVSPIPPVLTQNNYLWQIALASVYVASGAVVINSGDITDLREISSQNTTSESICGELYSDSNSSATIFTNTTSYVPMVVSGAGTLTDSPTVLFTQSPNGSLVYNGFNNIYFKVTVSLSYDANLNNTSLDFCLLKNGSLVNGSLSRNTLVATGAYQSASFSKIVKLNTFDVITIGIRNRSWTSSETITVITYNIAITGT